jgi:3-oxoadipate enol-lactonase/4-carboxymuconolactone decarboxylase
MARLDLQLTELAGAGPDAPLLVVGPSLGTSVAVLWGPVAAQLDGEYTVLGWDLPGHGSSASASDFDVADLAAGVLAALDGRVGADAGFHYAGDSLGGAVGLQLALDAPDRVRSATLCCTGAKIGEPEIWYDRAAKVRSEGTSSLVDTAPSRWFGPGFADRDPETVAALLDGLGRCDDEGYAAACEALAGYDVRDRLADIAVPVLAVAGASDPGTTPAHLRHIGSGVQNGRTVVLEGVCHLAPAEAPDRIAELIIEHTGEQPRAPRTTAQVRADGMRVRREVLGDVHVDRALAGTTELTAEFQDFITAYAWGSVWTRPGLDRRSRSMITLTALVARGHHDELAMHVRAARTNGLSNAEIAEVFLQSAIYCGVPDANSAFRIAQRVLAELDAADPEPTEPSTQPEPTEPKKD